MTSAPVDAAEAAAMADQAVTEAASAETTDGTAAAGSGRNRTAELEQEGEIAADYLEGLLDLVDLDGDLDLDVEGDRATVAIVGADLQDLVGRNGEVLEALQELTRIAVLQATGQRSRLMLDVAGYRAARRADLAALGAETAAKVLETGEAVRLVPMSPFERKVVHDAVTAVDGVVSESEGEEPQRRVVVKPA